jgi:hypothetical protein
MIYTMNGWEFPDIMQRYYVQYYPYFVYIAPHRGDGPVKQDFAGTFQHPQRTYDTMLSWMLTSAEGLREKPKAITNQRDFAEIQTGEEVEDTRTITDDGPLRVV